MTTEVAIYAASVPDRMRYAEALSGASLLPAAYRGKPANVLLALEYGAALGIAPMVAIQGIHVIEGKPSASAGLIGALVRKAGHRMRVTGDDRSARCEITRADDPDFTFVAEWTMDRARAAKLTGKQVWQQYPAAMLKARAITECARDACPEALSGVNYTAEELGDDATGEAYPAEVTVEVIGAPLVATDEEIERARPTSEAIAEVMEDAYAEVVDETTEGIADQAADYDERYGGERKASKASVNRLWALIAQRKPDLKGDATARLAWTSETLGRDVESWNDLRQSDANRLGDALERLPEVTS